MQTSLRITTAVVRDHTPGLVAVARRMARNRADADDLVQETWLGALGAAESFQGRASVRTWLNAILRRRSADWFRRSRPSTELQEEMFAADEDTAQRLLTCELASHALRLMPELNPLERDALALCAFADCDRDEACERLGITRSHLRVLLYRARRKLEALAR